MDDNYAKMGSARKQFEVNRRLLNTIGTIILIAFGLIFFFSWKWEENDPRLLFLLGLWLLLSAVGLISVFFLRRCPVCHCSFKGHSVPECCSRCGTPFHANIAHTFLEGNITMFRRFFTIEIFLEIHPEMVRIQHRACTLTLQPVIDISLVEDPPKILAIGGESTPHKPYQRIYLFDPSPASLGLFEKHLYLITFFRYAIQRVIRRNWMLRPTVTIKGLSSIHHIFCGYQDVLLYQALASTGANKIQFIDDEGTLQARKYQTGSFEP